MKLYRLKRLWLDLRMGSCSGFPSCCITWYVTVWKLTQNTRFWWWYGGKVRGRGYVPCPLCLLSKARVKVNRCTAKCGHDEESQQLTLKQYPRAKFR